MGARDNGQMRPTTVSGAVSSITRNGSGQVTAFSGPGGYSGSVTYDGQGRPSTFTENGVTKTATYNGDGTVASYL